jgi:hypothetical protein
MNALFGFAYQEDGPGFQSIAWKVFIAFDEGEYVRPDIAEMQGEIRTRWLLEEIVELRRAHHQTSPPVRCPCCLCRTLRERGGFGICPVCFWEDDGQDDHDADEVRGGPNGSLSPTEPGGTIAHAGRRSRDS